MLVNCSSCVSTNIHRYEPYISRSVIITLEGYFCNVSKSGIVDGGYDLSGVIYEVLQVALVLFLSGSYLPSCARSKISHMLGNSKMRSVLQESSKT